MHTTATETMIVASGTPCAAAVARARRPGCAALPAGRSRSRRLGARQPTHRAWLQPLPDRLGLERSQGAERGDRKGRTWRDFRRHAGRADRPHILVSMLIRSRVCLRVRRAVTRTRAASTIPAAPNTPDAESRAFCRHRRWPGTIESVLLPHQARSSPRSSSRGGRPPDQRTVLASSSQITREAPRGGGWSQTIASHRSSRAACRQVVSDSNTSLAGPSLPSSIRGPDRGSPSCAQPGASNIVRKTPASRSCDPPGDRSFVGLPSAAGAGGAGQHM